MKLVRCSKRVVLAGLMAVLMVSLVLGSGCAKPEATPTPTPTPTPAPKVEVIIYTDFQCHNCADLFFNVEEELVQLYGNTSRVSIEVRPINGYGNVSLLAGEAALCAKDQGQFWEYAKALFTAWRQAGAAAYSEEELIKTAIALGLNEEAFSSCLETGAKKAEVEANKQALVDSGESEIPMVYINGHKIKGVKPLQTYVDYIQGLKVEVIIYSDFQCYDCADLFFNVEEELLQLYGNSSKVRLEVRPINGLGNASLLAGEAALCAKDQGRFWEYSNALFTAWRQAGAAAYSEEELIKTAGALGLNEEAFSSCLETGMKKAEVEANKQTLVDSGEEQVPIFYINGNEIKGIKPLQTYVDFIDYLLNK
jgi:protein-disulfide isomerase